MHVLTQGSFKGSRLSSVLLNTVKGERLFWLCEHVEIRTPPSVALEEYAGGLGPRHEPLGSLTYAAHTPLQLSAH